MKIKVSKDKLNINYRGSPRGGRTQQHAYCLRYAHSQHVESHLGKKQQQAKIPIAFLFSQLHFNNITSHALFYGGHLVMRSKRCEVQNQGITLKTLRFFLIRPFKGLSWLSQAKIKPSAKREIVNAEGERNRVAGYFFFYFLCPPLPPQLA